MSGDTSGMQSHHPQHHGLDAHQPPPALHKRQHNMRSGSHRYMIDVLVYVVVVSGRVVVVRVVVVEVVLVMLL